MESYIEFKTFLESKGLLDRTIKEYVYYLDKFVKGLEGEPSQEYINTYISKNNNIVSRAFLKNYLEFINNNELKVFKITGTKINKKDLVEYITREEVNLIYEGMKNTGSPLRNSIMVGLSFQGALRVDELLHIKSNSFRWIKWKENQEEPLELVVLGKRNKKRVVNLTPDLAMEVRSYIKKLQVIINLEPDDLIFNIGYRRWHDILNATSKRIIGRNVGTHIFRHSFAMYAKDVMKWSIEKISKYLGHASIQTTMIYARTTDLDIKESFKKGFC